MELEDQCKLLVSDTEVTFVLFSCPLGFYPLKGCIMMMWSNTTCSLRVGLYEPQRSDKHFFKTVSYWFLSKD